MSDRSSDDGITIIELVIAVGLSLMLLFAVLSALDSGTRAERGQQAKQQALLGLRSAMTRITKDVRQAVFVAPASTRSRLVMRTIVGGNEQNMTYEVVNGDEMQRQLEGIPPGVPLTTGITNATTVFCFDPPVCTATSPPPTMTRIRVTLVGLPEVGAPQSAITLATDVELRNL